MVILKPVFSCHSTDYPYTGDSAEHLKRQLGVARELVWLGICEVLYVTNIITRSVPPSPPLNSLTYRLSSLPLPFFTPVNCGRLFAFELISLSISLDPWIARSSST